MSSANAIRDESSSIRFLSSFVHILSLFREHRIVASSGTNGLSYYLNKFLPIYIKLQSFFMFSEGIGMLHWEQTG